jgi:uncharacterized protein (DUF305 family)
VSPGHPEPGPAADPRDDAAARPLVHGRGRSVAAIVVALVVVAVLAFAGGRLTAATRDDPNTTSAEAGFLRDMQTHHMQAGRLSLLLLERSSNDAVRLVATDILTAQTQQAGVMYGWLVDWGLPQASTEPSMTWMTTPALDGSDLHEHGAVASGAPTHAPGDPMPGLATADQLAELEAADGTDADRIFLELMIAHHLGGVEMAEAIEVRTTNDEVLELAEGIITLQDSEIALMEDLLAELPAE